MAKPTSSSSPFSSSSYASIFLQNRDKMRLLQFPDAIITKLEPIVRASWAPGIQGSRRVAEAYEFKLAGCPWGILGDREAVGGRILLRNVLAFLYSQGWLLVSSVSTSRVVGCKDTMIFRQRRTAPGTTTTALSAAASARASAL